MRQKLCPTLLDVDGDTCHHINNAAKMFTAPSGHLVEQLFTELHTDHQWPSDEVISTDIEKYKSEIY